MGRSSLLVGAVNSVDDSMVSRVHTSVSGETINTVA